MSRFGFGFSGLYKLELAFFFTLGSAYLSRYFCSYANRSSSNSSRLATVCFRRFNFPKSSSDSVLTPSSTRKSSDDSSG